MNKETKTLLLSLGVAMVLLYIFRPKKPKISETKELLVNKYEEPKLIASEDKKLKDDAVVALQAMRDAINDNASAKDLEELKNILLKENNVQVSINTKTKLLTASSKDGKIIAEEG